MRVPTNLPFLCLSVAALVLGSPAGRATADDPALAPAAAEGAPPEMPGMRRIFNGRDLAGWSGDERMWSVRDGVIRGETTAAVPAKGNTFLVWQEGTLRDFELRLSFRCTADNNSGIQYRSRHVTDGSAPNPWVVRGYQHEVRNEADFPNVAGFIYDEGGKRGRICLVGERARWADGAKQVDGTLVDQEAWSTLFRLDDFNDVVIVAEGTRLRHYLNDRLILDFTDDPALALREGVLALQLHAGRPMWAEFRDVRLRELSE
ncbi:MAG: DUF1080 domain-containing protein [Planctomycetaceae bacterium]